MDSIERNYFNVHAWLRREFGKADKCENIDCSAASKRCEWALVKGKSYEKKRENFIQLCSSCHRRYDFTEKQRQSMRVYAKNNHFSFDNPMKKTVFKKKAADWMRNRIVGDETRKKVSVANKGKIVKEETKSKISEYRSSIAKKIIDTNTGVIYRTVTEAAISFNMKRGTLSAMLIGTNRNKTTLKYV